MEWTPGEGLDSGGVVLEPVEPLGGTVGGSHRTVPNVEEIVVAAAG